jgi:hypothetical protein
MDRTYRIYDFCKIVITEEDVEIQVRSARTKEQKPC